jgi:hypothetical protein
VKAHPSPRLLWLLGCLIALVAIPPSVAAVRPTHEPDKGAQGIPEYGALLSGIASGLQSTKPIYTCPGLGLTEINEALQGPGAVQRLATKLVAEALGSPKKPWPKNTRSFTYEGRWRVPDFVKGRSFYEVDTRGRLELTPEIRDLQAIARRQGRNLVIVTRRKTAISAALSRAISASSKRSGGRIRVVRCV